MTIQTIKQHKMAIISLAVIAGFAWMLYSFMHPETTPDVPVNTEKLIEFESTELEEKQAGKLVWHVTAEKIMIDPDTQVMYFTNPKAVFVSDDGTELTVASPQGSADRNKKTLTIQPPVHASTNLGDTLQTDGAVYYNMGTKMVKGGGVVIKRHDQSSLKADAFETNTSLDQISLTGHAQVTRGE